MPVAPSGQRWHEEIDIGVVGAGGCGLVAAHAAAGSDVSVVVWDKATAAGGDTALSWGMIAAAGTRQQREAGIFDVGEDFAHDVLARNRGGSDPSVTRRLCDSSAALLAWLTDVHGIKLQLVKQVYDPGHRHLRLHTPPSHGGQALIDPLVRSCARRGITLHLSAPVLQVWTDTTGAAVGVQIKRPRKTPANIRCRKVILACDGFAANPMLLQQHCPDASALTYAGSPTSRGDGLAWAADLGAATRDLDAYEAYAPVAVGAQLLIPWALMANGAVLVNQRGTRIAAEAHRPADAVCALRSQPGNVAYAIFDTQILQRTAADDAQFSSQVAPRVVRRADEPGELAKQFQIDPDTLSQTVGTASVSPVQLADGPHPLTPPFYGIRVTAALVQTQGGLVIDSSARVLRPDGAPVPNLYAGGGAAAGVSGAGNDGYLFGTGLLCALGWGKIAGEEAANEVLAARASTTSPTATPTEESDH